MDAQDPVTRVLTIYRGSDGAATKALYHELQSLGPAGRIAALLLSASKSSTRAKVYRGGTGGKSFRRLAYDHKEWALDELCRALVQHAGVCGLRWGWRPDPAQSYHNQVLYVDLPTGQVSFHALRRGDGPDYPDQWDGRNGMSGQRCCSWAASLLRSQQADLYASTCKPPDEESSHAP